MRGFKSAWNPCDPSEKNKWATKYNTNTRQLLIAQLQRAQPAQHTLASCKFKHLRAAYMFKIQKVRQQWELNTWAHIKSHV